MGILRNKKKNKMAEDIKVEEKDNIQQENVETTENAEQEANNETATLENDEEKQEDTVASLGQKLIEANNKYLTLYADFENFRKHSNKQRLDLIENAGEDLIKSLLPILDDFDRALQNMAKSEDEMVKQMLEGMNLIYKKFYGILEKKGLKPIDAKGKAFDENLHEAVTMFPAPTEEDKGKVIDEVEKGYFLNNKVLRFSKVVVAQ